MALWRVFSAALGLNIQGTCHSSELPHVVAVRSLARWLCVRGTVAQRAEVARIDGEAAGAQAVESVPADGRQLVDQFSVGDQVKVSKRSCTRHGWRGWRDWSVVLLCRCC